MLAARDALWVVSAYFNPAGYTTRLDNFHVFRRHLDAPLLVVEVAAAGRHQLRPTDADVVLSLTGEDHLWQKERLLNIGMSALPADARYVAWVDADVVLERPGWAEEAARHLERHGGLLQLFERAVHVSRDASRGSAFSRDTAGVAPVLTEPSIGAAARLGQAEAAFDACLAPDRRRANGDIWSLGMAWAATRAVVERCGLYDGAIVGGGDVLLVAAAVARAEALERRVLTRHEIGHWRAWMARARAAQLFRHLDALPQQAFHLWHGDLRDRGYGRRLRLTADHDFDPAADLRRADNGTWRWTRPDSDLARAVAAYFASRRED